MNIRTFIALLFSAMGDIKAGSLVIQSLIDDWEARDRCYDCPKQNDVLCRVYSMKWSFFGDEKSLHMAVRLAAPFPGRSLQAFSLLWCYF